MTARNEARSWENRGGLLLSSGEKIWYTLPMFKFKRANKKSGIENLAAIFSGSTLAMSFVLVLLLFFMLFLVAPYWTPS